MARPKQEPLPPAVKRLQQRVQKWRQSKEGRFSSTPVEVWDTAVALSVKYGVGRIARTVGLDYGALRKRIAELTRKPTGKSDFEQSITFVEVPTSGVMRAEKFFPESQPEPAPDSGLLIDISRPDGARMRISLTSGIDIDAAGIVAAFAGRGH